MDLKLLILATDAVKDREGVKPKQLRVREIKRDYMLGNIMRDHTKELKNLGLNSNKLAVQVLDEEEQLTEN